jgi:hypothetical protein
MTARRFRAVWLRSMNGSVFALGRMRNGMWRVFSSPSTIYAAAMRTR